MSQTTKEQIERLTTWGSRIVFGVSSFLLVSFAYDMKSDVKTVLMEQQVIKEKVRRIEGIK